MDLRNREIFGKFSKTQKGRYEQRAKEELLNALDDVSLHSTQKEQRTALDTCDQELNKIMPISHILTPENTRSARRAYVKLLNEQAQEPLFHRHNNPLDHAAHKTTIAHASSIFTSIKNAERQATQQKAQTEDDQLLKEIDAEIDAITSLTK